MPLVAFTWFQKYVVEYIVPPPEGINREGPTKPFKAWADGPTIDAAVMVWFHGQVTALNKLRTPEEKAIIAAEKVERKRLRDEEKACKVSCLLNGYLRASDSKKDLYFFRYSTLSLLDLWFHWKPADLNAT